MTGRYPTAWASTSARTERWRARHGGTSAPRATGDVRAGRRPAAHNRGIREITDNPARSRFELVLDGELVGWLDYRPAGESVILAHTEVLDGHEGEGLGGTLVQGALEAVGGSGKTVIPTCPFAAAYIDRHPELDEYVAPSFRRR